MTKVHFGILGKSLSHSFSKSYFTEKFTKLNLENHVFENHELNDIKELIPKLNNRPNVRGLSVTIPFKEEIISYLDHSSPEVKAIGACNCVKISYSKDGSRILSGYNTDVIGFTKSLKKKLKSTDTKALILGLGGASKAIQHSLDMLGIVYLKVGRNNKGDINYNELDKDIMQSHQLIINTTPIGMYPKTEEKPLLPYDLLTETHFLFDLIYNPENTLFLKEGIAKGCRIQNGMDMLHYQADAAWEYWQK